MAKLLQAEVIRGMVQQQQQQQHANSTFTSRIMDRMISNVVVRLRNVQVKFESLRYSFSLNIGRFDMYNTDANWSPFYSQDPQSQFKLTRDNSSKVDIQVQDLLEVVVVHSQLENLVEILKLRAVSKLRPTQPPIVAPRQWWQYACQILLKRIKDKRYRRTKEYFTKRRRDRLEYTYLWKLFLSSENGNNNSSATTTTTTTIASSNNGQVVISPSSFANTHNKLSANNKAKLEFLESYLDLADILLFRAYAENELRLEKAHQELWAMSTAAAAAQKQAQPTSESGWISWARGMRTFPAGSSNNSSQKESLSQQDVERFLALLRFNPAKAVLEATHAPASLAAGSGLRLRLEQLELEVQKRLTKTTIKLSLKAIQAFDGEERICEMVRDPATWGALGAILEEQVTPEPEERLVRGATPDGEGELWWDHTRPGSKPSIVEEEGEENGYILRLCSTEDAQTGAKSMSLNLGALETVLTPLVVERAGDLAKLVGSFTSRRSAPSSSSLAITPPPASIHLGIGSLGFKLPMKGGITRSYLTLSLASCVVKDQFLKEEDDLSSNDEGDDEDDDGLGGGGGNGDSLGGENGEQRRREIISEQLLVHVKEIKLVLQRGGNGGDLQLLDPFAVRVLINSKRRGVNDVESSYRIDLPEQLNVRLFPTAIGVLHQHYLACSASKTPVMIVESWLKSCLLTPLPNNLSSSTFESADGEGRRDANDMVFGLDSVHDSDLHGGAGSEYDSDRSDSANGSDDAVSEFFTVYDEFMDSTSEASKPATSAALLRPASFQSSRKDDTTESHYSFFTVESRRTRRSLAGKRGKPKLASISTSRSKLNIKIKIPGVRMQYYEVEDAPRPSPPMPHRQSTSVASSPKTLGGKKLPHSASASTLPADLLQDWLNEIPDPNEWGEGNKSGASTPAPYHHSGNALLVLRLDRIEFEWSQRHKHFSLGQVTCRTGTNPTPFSSAHNLQDHPQQPQRILDTCLFSSELALDKDFALVSADHMERAVFFSVDWEHDHAFSAKTHFPLDIVTGNLDKLWNILPATTPTGAAPRTDLRSLLHCLLSVSQVRMWFRNDSFFTLSNLDLAIRRGVDRIEVKGRLGTVTGHQKQNCFYAKLALEEEDTFEVAYIFPKVEVRQVAEEEKEEEGKCTPKVGEDQDTMLDNLLESVILDSNAKGDIPNCLESATTKVTKTTYDVWNQGMEISITIAPIRIDVPLMYQFAQEFASSPGRDGSGTRKAPSSSIVRFQLHVLQPEFELGVEGVSLVCERIVAGNLHYLIPNGSVVERLDALVQQISFFKENASGHALPLIDPCLYELKAHKVARRVNVSLSDLVLNVDQTQLEKIAQAVRKTGRATSNNQSSIKRDDNKEEAGGGGLDVAVQFEKIKVNLIAYLVPSSVFHRAHSASNANGLVPATATNNSKRGSVADVTKPVGESNHRYIATICGERIAMRYSGPGKLRLGVDSFAVVAGSIRAVDLQLGLELSKQGSTVQLVVDQPKLRYDKPSWDEIKEFFRFETSLETPLPPATPSVGTALTFHMSIAHFELWMLPPHGTVGALMLNLYVSNALVRFTSLASFHIELKGISSWLRRFAVPQEEAKVRFICYPFNVRMPQDGEGDEGRRIEISPIRIQTTKRDLEAIWKLFSSSEAKSPAVATAVTVETSTSSKKKPLRVEVKLVLKSIDLVLLSEFSLPVAQLVISAFELNSLQSLLHGRVKVRAEFYKRQCWQVLMEEVPFAFHLNDSRLSLSSTNVMEWNLCESLLDNQLDGRVKINSLVNHTGLAVERLYPTVEGATHKDFFCSVGELLSFRLVNERGGGAFVLRNVVCPKPGQTNKIALGGNGGGFLVMETQGNVLVLRSLLQFRNDSANTIELFVGSDNNSHYSLSRPDTPLGSQHSFGGGEDVTPLTPSRRRSRILHTSPGVLFSAHLYPNEHFEFKELRISQSARQNEKRFKRTLSFGEESSISGSISNSSSSSFVHYAVDCQWLDQYAQCISFAAPLLLVNHLNCPATYCLEGNAQQNLAHYQISRCEGQLPVGNELKWHGVLLPQQSSQLRLSLKLAGYEWSDPVLICPGNGTEGVGETNTQLQLRDESNRILHVTAGVKCVSKQRVEITFSVPYWIVNKTQLPILCSSNSGIGAAAGQTKVLATMRRIRLQSQLQTASSITTPTGILEILQDDQAPVEDSIVLFAKSDLKIKFWNSRWSSTYFSLEHNSQMVLECKQEWKLTSPGSPRAIYVVAAKVTDAKFPETKIVTLTPRFILVNQLDRAVRIRQAKQGNGGEELGSSGFSSFRSHPVFSGHRLQVRPGLFSAPQQVSLLSGASSAFHWRDKSAPRQISACFEEFGWEWSSGVEIDDCVGEFCARLRNRLTHAMYILRMEVQVEGPSIVVTLREELPQLPPYRIDNLSLFTLRYRQVGTSTAETLLPYHSSAYSWDVLNRDRRLVVETLPRKSQEEAVDGEQQRLASLLPSTALTPSQFRLLAPSTWFARPKELGAFSLDHGFGFLPSSLPNLSVSLQADGPTRVLTICDSRVLQRDEDNSGNGVVLSKDDATLPPPERKLGFHFKIGGLGVSLVEDADAEGQVRRRELLRVFVSQPSVLVSRQVPLEPAVTSNSITKAAQAASMVMGNVYEVRLRDVQIDNQLLGAQFPVLMCLGSNAHSPHRSSRHQQPHRTLAKMGEDLFVARVVKSNRFASSLEFLKSVSITVAPIQLNLDAEILRATMSLLGRVSKKLPQHLPIAPAKSMPLSPSTTHQNGNRVKTLLKKIYVEELCIDPIHVRVNFRNVFSLLRTPNWFGANVEGAVLYLHEFRISHSLLSAASDPIANRVAAHYLQSLRRHWYVLISSVDLLGDPVGLGKTIGAGVVRALQEVHASLFSFNPLIVLYALGHGVWVVVCAVTLGMTNSLVNISNGVTGALMFLIQSPLVSFPPPRHLFDSFAQGVAGLVVYPFEAVRQCGPNKSRVSAFVRGTMRGVVGLVVLPAIGWLRLCTRVASALRTAVDPTAKVRTLRNRTPRFFRPDQRIRRFDPVRAHGEEALWLVGLGKQLHWRSHLELTDTVLLVFTDASLVLVKRREFTGDGMHLGQQIAKLDFVRAMVATTSTVKTTGTMGEEEEGWLRLIMLHPTALAFETIAVQCRSRSVARLAETMANAW
ncbi:hypothetical protein BASA81_000155 [Batrachochytrium salamandrivorans]|nr:hypothetical protein BASA81_000155 [Batrachochytrium salamandrivorans]